jgi:GH15 family glucan-1,4-alpha-glucosidase
MCWLALERGLGLASKLRLPVDSQRWQAARDEIRASIDAHGVDRKRGCFVRAYGSEAVDASLLRLALIGFVAPDDPRFVATVEAIRKDLGNGPFLRRYLPDDKTPDGLPPHEGAFLACAFWLVDVLAMQGRVHEAEKLFGELLARANDVGLLPEEIDPATGEFLGNFPQAFSHIAVINAAQQLQKERTNEDRARPVTERVGRKAAKLPG